MPVRLLPCFVLFVLGFAISASAADVVGVELRARLLAAAPGQQVDAYLVMQDQVSLEQLEKRAGSVSPRQRRSLVTEQLKRHAHDSQAGVRHLLDEAVAQGRAEIGEQLWIGNALLFRAEPDVIELLAARDDIDRIRSLRVTPFAQIQDMLAGPVVAPYPFADDFETGVLGSHWQTQTTGQGYVQISSLYGPAGQYHVMLGTSAGTATSSITLCLDLTGQSNVGLRFKHRRFNDIPHAEDAVFISDDGVTFHPVFNLALSPTTYTQRAIDLDAVVTQLGLSYTSTFYIRFGWKDVQIVPAAGYCFDDIEVGPGIGVPPPPAAESHVITLQATALWDAGFDGSGLLIASLDSGLEPTHPDLAQRLWSNPAETPGNGVDDDGNGKIDDIWGWDFIDDDNDPSSPLDPHGTMTAGLMVGDGANGKITGMAPGGSILACRISSESEYWLAQQYCVEMGVDVISSSASYKWPSRPDYMMFRQICEVELAAGIIHANSTGNQGQDLGTHPKPFNVPAPANCPQPWNHPEAERGGRSSVMACVGIHLSDDSIYKPSGRGPSAWEKFKLYDESWPHPKVKSYWDYPYGGFGGSLPGLLKPDVATFTDTVTSTYVNGSYGMFTGTSPAAAQLGGGLLLLRQVQPEAAPRHICAAVELTAVDLGNPGKDTRYGSGKLQVFDAARRLVLLGRASTTTPAIGSTFTLDLFGEKNALVHWFAGLTTAVSPTDFNLLAPIITLPLVQLNASGELSLPLTLPGNAGLVGLTAHMQFGSMPKDVATWGSAPLFSVPETITIQ